ncbi:YolA family protein [Burkholderia cenocepacia]|jgi:hypothetical protein|uniref:YolA family protein n=1 Tax=Burkholderia cenocepacia TaxID=95486 RepID=UPI0024B74EAB|nr:YolA family protein [Burkholderia cenocepacia]MDI9689709.1 YolA family protein [Burkholderia cenocepacia]
MKSTFFKQLLVMATIAGVSAAAQAEDVPRGQGVLTALPTLASHNKQIPAEPAATPQIKSGAVARAPAPPLTAMWVYAVGSTDCGWEYTAGLTTTTCNHGGAQLRSAVLEIGYGASRVAWMNSGVLPSSAMYASTPVCITGGYYTWPCTAGQTVVGFLNEYNLDGYQNGIFKYQNTSTNSPWNTMSVQISIL